MTNLIPIEALNHFLEGDYTEEQKKKVKRIKQAAESYEIRDLLLSINLKLGLAETFKDSNGKRFITCYGLTFPFKQQSPEVLVDHYYKNPAVLYTLASAVDYVLSRSTSLIFHDSLDDIINVVGLQKTKKALFFCNKEYTKQTGIEPHVVENYDELVEKYINYIKYKIGLKQ